MKKVNTNGVLMTLTVLLGVGLSTSLTAKTNQYCASTYNSCGAITICAENIDAWIDAYNVTDAVCSGKTKIYK